MKLPLILLSLSSFLTTTLAGAYQSPSALTTWEKIHQTINTYPLAIDGKNASLFASVFTADAKANYTGPFDNLVGPNITTNLLLSVTGKLSQHQLGTTVIDIDSKGATASASTYVTATLWGVPGTANSGKYVMLFARYEDELVDTGVGANGWRIYKRLFVFMGPLLGDCTLTACS